jgi:FAD/FMN-containing dehydrogenase
MRPAATGVDRAATTLLDEEMEGAVITPLDERYELARRVWNGSIDRRPAVIARCASVADVQRAVRFGRDQDLLCAVRAGGHSFPGLSVCDDGLVIDVRDMGEIRVGAAGDTVRVGAGALLGELDRATQEHGRVVPAGIVSHTGVAGLTLGGGLGWTQRKFGLTIDNLDSVELVAADGAVVHASAEENPELFWGIRGGGGNFGVVAEFEFRTRPLGPTVLGGPIFWRADDTVELLRFYRDWIADAPDELMTIVVQRRAPALPVVPPELVGDLVIGVVVCWSGPVDTGERVVEPLRRHGSPVLDLCAPTDFVAHQRSFDPSFEAGCWYYVRSCDVAELSDDVISIMADHGARIDSPMSSIALWQMGGALSRVADADTAFGGRHAGFSFNINGNAETSDGFDAERAWARSYWQALAPHHLGVYVNFLMEEGDERIRAAYGDDKYERLAALKGTYDPDNYFRLNQNIHPQRPTGAR